MFREHIWKVTDYFPARVQRIINIFIHNRWPVWGYHLKDTELWNNDGTPRVGFHKLTEFMKTNNTKWEYKRVKGYTHITIFDQDSAKKFCQRYNINF